MNAVGFLVTIYLQNTVAGWKKKRILMFSVVIYFLPCLFPFWVGLSPSSDSLNLHFVQLGGKLVIYCKLVCGNCVFIECGLCIMYMYIATLIYEMF